MKINEDIRAFIEVCKGIVMNCNCDILIIEMMGEYKAYLTNSVRLKTRDCLYSEVADAQDVTTIVNNVQSNFFMGMTPQRLSEVTQSIHKEDFKFGTDNYIWITRVDLNR